MKILGRKYRTTLGDERGGVDLIQFIVALLIIGIAAASATFSIFIGRGALDSEWRKKRALEIARDEVEYWSALIFDGQGGQAISISLRDNTIVREEVLDPRDQGQSDDIMCRVIREPIALTILLPGTVDIESYSIKVNVTWQEPSDNPQLSFPPDTVKLQEHMIYRYSISGGGGPGSPSGE